MNIVIVGVERSRVFGNCPGSELDANNMRKLFEKYSSNITFLVNESATISNVKSALKDAVKDDFAILYYSGHGGSEKFSDTDINEEIDEHDEFLCLYDGLMKDNDLWAITSESTGKVFEMFDCCHSETMFKLPGMLFRNAPRIRGVGNSPNLLVWSGCPDNTYSYGSSAGGVFTNTFLRHFDPGETYKKIWERIKSDVSLSRQESVQKTVVGRFDENERIFS